MPRTRIPYLRCLLSVTLLLLGPGAGARTVYKWVDEQGGVHYGGQAPDLTQGVTPVQIEELPEAAATRAPLRFRDTPARPRPRKGPSRTTRHDSAERLARRCARYRERLAYYTSKMRAGYRARQYNTLEGKRRDYRRRLHRECR